MDITQEELASAPGIGTTLAKRIQEHLRQANEGARKIDFS